MNAGMKGKTEKNRRFDELIRRIRAVEEVVGYDILYHSPAGFNKKTVEKWLRADAFPRTGSLREFCRCAGLTKAEFDGSEEAFVKALARVSVQLRDSGKQLHEWDESRVARLMKSHDKGGGLMSALSDTVNAIGQKAMENYFRQFQGYYFGYLNWTKWTQGEGQRPALRGSAFRCLIKVDALETDTQVIRAKLTTRHHVENCDAGESAWAYEGVMVPIPGKLVFIFEAPDPSFENMEFIFIIAQNAPKDHMLGIISSDSSIPDSASMMQVRPIPSASRILLKKAARDLDENALMDELDYRREIDPEILKVIENEINRDTGILMTHFVPPGA